MADTLIGVIGLSQLICSLVLVGLVAKEYAVILSQDETVTYDVAAAIHAAAIIILSVVVLINGVMGLLSMMCGVIMRVLYMLGATVTACLCVILIWFAGIKVYHCKSLGAYFCDIRYTKEQQDINKAILAFACLCAGTSVAGSFITAIATCQNLDSGLGSARQVIVV